MKRVLSLILVVIYFNSWSQDLTSRKGEPILPEAGDIAISIDAGQWLLYFASFRYDDEGESTPNWAFVNNDMTLVGKIFKDEKTAYRALIRIGLIGSKATNDIMAPSGTAPTFPALPEMTMDTWKHNQTAIFVGSGLEKRTGKTRLQSFLGADAIIGFFSMKDVFDYGNAADPNGTIPVSPNDPTYTTDFSVYGYSLGNLNYNNATYTNNRMLSMRSGGYGIGARTFVGAEYFVFPKVAFGAEFSWGLSIARINKTNIEYEAEGGTSPSVSVIEEDVLGTGGWSFDTGLNGVASPSAPGSPFGSGVAGAMKITVHF